MEHCKVCRAQPTRRGMVIKGLRADLDALAPINYANARLYWCRKNKAFFVDPYDKGERYQVLKIALEV